MVGFQFRPEQTLAAFQRWQARDDDWGRYSAPGVQQRDEQTTLMLEHDAAQGAWFTGFLDRFFADAR